jgi:hypothetical protein
VRFTDLTAAFEEMEWLVKTTGHTYRIIHAGTNTPAYHVVQKSGSAKVPFLIAELNCRNVVGDEHIQKRRGRKAKKKRAGVKENIRDGLYQYSAPSRRKVER